MNLSTEQLFEIRDLVRAEIDRQHEARRKAEEGSEEQSKALDKIKRLDSTLLALIPQSQPIDTSGGLAQALAACAGTTCATSSK